MFTLNFSSVISGLRDIRDLFSADFSALMSLISQLPDENSLLELENSSPHVPTQLEQRIIAMFWIMCAETESGIINLLGSIFGECEAIAGVAPCRYTFVVDGRCRLGCCSPFQPFSYSLVTEKDGAEHKQYFRTLLTLFAMKIINLGETPLSLIRIKSLQWYVENIEQKATFSLFEFILDTEETSIFTITNLAQSARSHKKDERATVYNVCDGIKFVSGDHTLFKELSDLRSIVIQRDQANLDYKIDIKYRITQLITSVEFANQEFTKDASDSSRGNEHISLFLSKFLKVMFDLNKKSKEQDSRTRLEELANSMVSASYTSCSARTEFVDDLLRTTISQAPESATKEQEWDKKHLTKTSSRAHIQVTQPKNASHRVISKRKPAKTKGVTVYVPSPVATPYHRKVDCLHSCVTGKGFMKPESFHPLMLADVLSSCLELERGIPNSYPKLTATNIATLNCHILKTVLALARELRPFAEDSSLAAVFRKTIAYSGNH